MHPKSRNPPDLFPTPERLSEEIRKRCGGDVDAARAELGSYAEVVEKRSDVRHRQVERGAVE